MKAYKVHSPISGAYVVDLLLRNLGVEPTRKLPMTSKAAPHKCITGLLLLLYKRNVLRKPQNYLNIGS